MLHKDNDRKGFIEKKTSGSESEGDWHQEELVGGKPTVISNFDCDFDFDKGILSGTYQGILSGTY
jgi:hypothetical protein